MFANNNLNVNAVVVDILSSRTVRNLIGRRTQTDWAANANRLDGGRERWHAPTTNNRYVDTKEPKTSTNTLHDTIPICVHFAHLNTNRLTSCRYFACHFVKKAAKPFIPKS